ncbi:ABC transporter permease [Paractinoplanes atraurantiacus]|uniref:Ribose/xylose/arabinose/galactoside ABC-type transport system, permease component n=1 Tax=Paractinoplanes atraurantiacus TaxID=1036182 RepID=A0A285F1W4_9ACTN|nr:ABC transporter permease [Actinoplanes atraurantiacus]SNY04376.1 Ribose/xylose/arabinose/galactoside ABC-type transport system, permease component [Actinoplanes atraurantiacus]
MAYDEATYRRPAEEQPSDPAAYRANTLAAAEQRRRAEQLDDQGDTTTTDVLRRVDADEDGRDRLGIHLGWEVVLLVAAVAIGYMLWRADSEALQRPGLDNLLVTGAAIGLLTLGAGLTLRAGVPNLALGPIALAAALQYAEQGDQGLVKAVVPALVIAAAGAVLIALLILVLHVPGWAATLAAGLGVIVYDQLRVTPVVVQGDYDPTEQAFFLFGGFALLAVLGGALGTVGPVRRWLGRLRPAGDPAARRGAVVAVPVIGTLVISSVFAVAAGVLFAAQSSTPIVPGTGLEWTGIALGLAMLAGTSAYGRRGGIFGTLFAVSALTLFLDYQAREKFDIALFAIAAAVFGGGLIVTRLVETYGKPLPAAGEPEWNAAPATTSANWSPDLPETWSTTTSTGRTDRWDAGPWGTTR